MALLMEPGQTYNSWEEFKEALDAHSKEKKVIFNISNAKTVEQTNAYMKTGPLYDLRLKYVHCKLQCKHFGSYTSSSAGARPKQRSYKIDCRAFISVSACRNQNYLIIRDSYHMHSHPCTEEIYNSYPEVRRMTKDERRMVGTLLDMGVPVSQVKSAIGKNVLAKDLHNAKGHVRAVKMGLKSDDRKSRSAHKRDTYVLSQDGDSVSELDKKSICATTVASHSDPGEGSSHNDAVSFIQVHGSGEDDSAPLATEGQDSVSEETVIEEKTIESNDQTVTNFLNSLNSQTESVIAVTNDDTMEGEKTSYTVIVSTGDDDKHDSGAVTNLHELFHKLQTEGLPKKSTATSPKVPTTRVPDDDIQGQAEDESSPDPQTKNCANCNKYMSPLDGHSLCLVCLGPQHLHEHDCEHCSVMKPEQLNIRRKLLVRIRMKALKELNQSKRKGSNNSAESNDSQPASDDLFQPRKSKRKRKPKDFGPDIAVSDFFSNKDISPKSRARVTKCVVSDGEKEYMVEIPKRGVIEEDCLDYSLEDEASPSDCQNSERFNHLLKQTSIFDDVVLEKNSSGVLGYEPDASSVLEITRAMSQSNIPSAPAGVVGKYGLDSQFESSYCSVPPSLDVPGDHVLNTMGSGLHKLVQNANIQTRLAIYDKLFSRLGVGMADEALGILSQLYGKVTHVTEISQEDLTNDLQTALDTIQALKDVLEELGCMSKDALSTASHQRSISLHSIEKARKALKKTQSNVDDAPSTSKRRKFEPFTKQRLTNQTFVNESQSELVAGVAACDDSLPVKFEVNTDDPSPGEQHIVMEVSSLSSDISPSVLAPIMTVSPMSLSSELLERLQNQKDGLIELNMLSKDDVVIQATTSAE